MSRTISDLDLGTEITLQESGVDTSYILIRKDSYGCVLLRALCAGSRRMNPTNTAVYEGSEMDDYLVNEETGYLSRFDSDTIATLASRSISTYNYGDTEYRSISRKCYLLSYGELYGSTPSATEPDTSVLPALMIFKGTSEPNTARISSIDGHAAVFWWLRSPYSAAAFYRVYSYGASTDGSASLTNALRPALNIAPATVVSEIADKIYLVAPSDPIKKVQFHGKVLETQLRPKKALVQYNAVNLDNITIEVTNNYGDPTPVWVDATGQTEITLANDEKQTTNWQIGVRCYGESYGFGYFEEPLTVRYLTE